MEANRSAGHPVAGSSERRPAEERHSPLQHPQAGHPLAGSSEMRPAEDRHLPLQQTQAGLQAPHMQAQPQVPSPVCVFDLTTLGLQLLTGGTCLLMVVSSIQGVCNCINSKLLKALVDCCRHSPRYKAKSVCCCLQ